MVSNCDLGGMYSYSPASKCSSALPHQPSQIPRHDQYEIPGLKFSKKILRVYALHFQSRISGISSPCLLMYSWCSMSFSFIFCLR
ncbi:MAG: hypothetical protein K9M81_03525 [Chthoniobacterales bacterium]|nr:hypothetical protein [Chthoniobacterales bacterium]